MIIIASAFFYNDHKDRVKLIICVLNSLIKVMHNNIYFSVKLLLLIFLPLHWKAWMIYHQTMLIVVNATAWHVTMNDDCAVLWLKHMSTMVNLWHRWIIEFLHKLLIQTTCGANSIIVIARTLVRLVHSILMVLLFDA